MNIDNETIGRVEQLGEQIGRMYIGAFVELVSSDGYPLGDLLYREIMRHIADIAPAHCGMAPPVGHQ